MNTDIRISVSFKSHRKRAKFRMLVGERATDYLIDLWLSVAMDRPDGNLQGLDDMDIAIMSGWTGEPKVFVDALISVGFLDSTTVERPLNGVTTNGYSLHDWTEHNGYACAADDRSDKSRFSRMAKTHPVIYEELKAKSYTSITSEEYKRLTTVERPLTNRLSPLPSPLPLPSIKEEPAAVIPYDGIMAAFNKFCPSLPQTIQINENRRTLIKAAFLKYQNHEGGAMHTLDTLFKKAERSRFLTGKAPGYQGKSFKAKFDWIMDEEKMVKILEGDYDDAPEPPPHVTEFQL